MRLLVGLLMRLGRMLAAVMRDGHFRPPATDRSLSMRMMNAAPQQDVQEKRCQRGNRNQLAHVVSSQVDALSIFGGRVLQVKANIPAIVDIRSDYH